MILQEALNAGSLAWRVLMFDFIDELRCFLVTGETQYRMSFLKLGSLFEQRIPLADKSGSGEGAV